MRPSDNAIGVVKILWRNARVTNTRDGWQRCSDQLGGIQFYLYEPLDEQSADYLYIKDMQEEAWNMLEVTK